VDAGATAVAALRSATQFRPQPQRSVDDVI
jgi:hypothetical protein